MRDTKPKVATCNRCSRIVLAAMSSGFRAAVDPAPLTLEEVRDVLIAGRHVYRMYMQNGKLAKLGLVTVATLKLPAAPYATYAAAHGCGCHAMDATAFEEPVDPSQAPVSALDDSQGRSRARDATQRLSELPAIRCAHCKVVIPAGDGDRIMLEWPVWTSVTHKYQNRGPRKGHEKTFEGWGVERWAIHPGPDGCRKTTDSNGKTT